MEINPDILRFNLIQELPEHLPTFASQLYKDKDLMTLVGLKTYDQLILLINGIVISNGNITLHLIRYNSALVGFFIICRNSPTPSLSGVQLGVFTPYRNRKIGTYSLHRIINSLPNTTVWGKVTEITLPVRRLINSLSLEIADITSEYTLWVRKG